MSMVLLAACRENKSATPDTSQVAGSYRGHYRGGTEFINLQVDGSFSQRFVMDSGKELYSLTGQWHIAGKQVVMSPFFYVADPADSNATSPKRLDVGGGTWSAPNVIEIGGWPYFVTK